MGTGQHGDGDAGAFPWEPQEDSPPSLMWPEMADPARAPRTEQFRQAVLELHQRLGAVERAVQDGEASRALKEFDRRLEALKAARAHVDGLATQKPNERGYADHALKGALRVAEELRVARFLLGEGEG